ncbi:hypothetical protein [Promicromonospora sp. NPDC023987]|uniref:hypothetical protein n=1 Tax=Promicromonospora sp. NPDC023987 TaxID=3155360 RepID=UPI0033F9234B
MHPSDLALLVASDELGTGKGPFPLDRVRMQKAIFLLTQRGPRAWKTLYQYEPYNWGPYSGALASDLNRLVQDDLLAVRDVPQNRYGSYQATGLAAGRTRTARAECTPEELAFIKSVRDYVTSKSFANLLKEVYAEYPEFATKSRFTG